MEHEKKISWFKAMRSDDSLELISRNPMAYILAAVIAHRARWKNGFNHHELSQGEAFLGDFENYGMTARQYRTAKHQLQTWHFATFKTTNKGTIARLSDSRLFEVSNFPNDNQNDKQETIKRQSRDNQETTNYNDRTYRKEKGIEGVQADASADSCASGANTVETPSAFLSAKKSANDIGNEKEITRINDELKSLGRATDYAKGSEERNRIIQLRERKKVLLKILGRVA